MDLAQLKKALEAAGSESELFAAIVEEPLAHKVGAAHLFLGFIVLYLVPKGKRIVKLISVSDTEYYEMAIKGYNKFSASDFELSLTKDTNNSIVKTILTGEVQNTADWRTLRRSWADPVTTNLNQANSGISSSVIYPLDVPRGGALMFCFYNYQQSINSDQHKFMKEYSQLVSELLSKTS